MTVRVNTYAVISRAVEEGVAAGWRRAHKHGKPTEAQAIDAIVTTVMGDLCDVLVFDETGAAVADTSESSTGGEGQVLPSQDPPHPLRSSKRGRRGR